MYIYTYILENSRQNMGENRNMWCIASVAYSEGESLASWMGSATTWMIRWCLCDNTTTTALWAGVCFDGLLGRIQVSRWVAMVPMAKKLLHRRKDVLTRVYVHFFAVSVACTKQVSRVPVHVQICTLYRCFWHQFIYLQTHPPQRMHVRSCVSSLFHSVGGRGWGDQLVYARHFLLAWNVFFWNKER